MAALLIDLKDGGFRLCSANSSEKVPMLTRLFHPQIMSVLASSHSNGKPRQNAVFMCERGSICLWLPHQFATLSVVECPTDSAVWTECALHCVLASFSANPRTEINYNIATHASKQLARAKASIC